MVNTPFYIAAVSYCQRGHPPEEIRRDRREAQAMSLYLASCGIVAGVYTARSGADWKSTAAMTAIPLC